MLPQLFSGNEMREPSWSIRVKIRDNYTCYDCGLGVFDHEIVDACHIENKSIRPDLAEDINNGRTKCMFDHAKEHFKKGEYWACVLVLLRLIKLVRKRARWPVISYKEYQTLSIVYHEGNNYEEAAQLLGCSRYTVRRRLNKIKKYYPDLITDKGDFYYRPLPNNYESFTKQFF